MRSICFNPKTPSFAFSPHSSPSRIAISTPRRSLSSASVVEQIVESAEAMIMKWNPESSMFARVTSLFYENKREAIQFIKCVNDLQKAMHLLLSEDPTDDRLVRAQRLMQIAMKILQKEFYQILSMNRAHLDPESVSARSSRVSARSSISDYEEDTSPEDEIQAAGDSISEVEEVSSIAMADLKSIAECMISSGYARECINIYKIIRKSIIAEGIYKLGVQKLTSSQINKMDWETLDLRIRSWLEAIKISMKTLFNGERILCDHVFTSSESLRESCFSEISNQGAILLFSFPELVAKTKKSSSSSASSPPLEKMFRVLDMYTAISENWIEIESIFSFESTSPVRSQALASLVRLSESTRSTLADFESFIQKDSSKKPVTGSGVHNLTINVINYLSLLADYSNILADIISDWPPHAKTSSPEFLVDTPDSDDAPAPAISIRFAWLILVLLCKLDGRAKHFKDVSFSYLFLTNNLRHVVFKVRTSNLQYILGEEWIVKHDNKVRQFAENYVRLAWSHVADSLPLKPSSVEEVKQGFKRFNLSFEEAFKKQAACVVSDPNFRDEIAASISRKLTPIYREFYDKYRGSLGTGENVGFFVKYAPEDVGIYLSKLFFATVESGNSKSSSSTTSSHGRNRPLGV